MAKDISRGIRNNNPGNIERNTKDKWQGLSPAQTDKRFCQFTDPVFGIRAIAKILINYQDKYGVNTLLGAIKKWAPPAENKTALYAQAVARHAGVATGGVIDFHRYEYLRGIVEGMIIQENGVQPYAPAQIDKGLALAGVLPPRKPLAASGTIKASTLGSVAATGAIGSGIIAQVEPAMPIIQQVGWMIQENGPTFLIVGGVCLLALFGYIAYRRWDDARRLSR